MKQYEYNVEVFADSDMLTRLGRDGWELVSVVKDEAENMTYFFKREIDPLKGILSRPPH